LRAIAVKNLGAFIGIDPWLKMFAN
jgi:hypothetical protein